VSQNAKQLNIILHLEESQTWPSNQCPNPCTSDPETPQPSIPQVCIKCQLTIRCRRLPRLPRRSILAGCALYPHVRLKTSAHQTTSSSFPRHSLSAETSQDSITHYYSIGLYLDPPEHSARGPSTGGGYEFREHFGAAQGFCTREFAADQGRDRKNVTNVMQEGPEIL